MNDPLQPVDVVDYALSLLGRHGWEVGFHKLVEWLPLVSNEPTHPAHALFLGWQAWERGRLDEAERYLHEIEHSSKCRGWALAGLAFVALRKKGSEALAAGPFLAEALSHCTADDRDLRGVVAQGQGLIEYHHGRFREARVRLGEALELVGRQHHLTGRLYDSLGMTWSGTGSFFVATEFYRKSLEFKQNPPSGEPDLPGLALTHGQLGRLYLQWGLLDQAWKHFHDDLDIAERMDDPRSRAQMLDYLGHVELRRADRFRSTGNFSDATRHETEALGWLDSCLRECAGRPDWNNIAAYGLKDRAAVLLSLDRLDEAEADLVRAEQLFHAARFDDGLAHVDLIRGVLQRRLRNWSESLRLLQKAQRRFDGRIPVELARAQWEIARTRRDAGEPTPVVAAAFLRALDTAESGRRPYLVSQIELELRGVDPVKALEAGYRRARGRSVGLPTTSLVDATRDGGSVLYLDVQGSTAYARDHDPEEVMLTINEMMADLQAGLRTYAGQVSGYRGDGFLALFRGPNHALRAVQAALAIIASIEEFNVPRQQLELEPLVVRTGVASGEMCWGNVGTYDKLDFTVVGTPANLGARLEAKARAGGVCISSATQELVGRRFRYSDDSPHQEVLKGLGMLQFWHVTGEAEPR